MYGHHITPSRVKTPIAERLKGFAFFHHVYGLAKRNAPGWCKYRHAEAWPFRPRHRAEG